MLISEFDFQLPDELIAQDPLSGRDQSRMLVVRRSDGSFADKQFTDFPEELGSSDVLVLNNTKVFPARLNGQLETGAAVELFLVEETDENIWIALARPGRRLKAGKKILFGCGLSANVIEKVGATPLPPYISRAASSEDRARYQTVYASSRGAIAAPTAGLHFTPAILDTIRGRGVEIREITLHVGYGTFEPVRVEHVAEHNVMPERFEIGPETAAALNSALVEGRRIVAVGTTTTRALETSVARHGQVVAERSLADLTIRPGYKFAAVTALLTNFHLPKSSLLVLVSTFGGHELIMNSYRHAVESRYRFYSYGDCMFVC
jgi:S-adenosylmethionine:tRNA ribosyltransferase-isomerase